MSLIGECYSDVGRREVASKDACSRKDRAEALLGICCESFPVPSWMVTVAERSVLGASLASTFKGRGKQTNGCFTWPHTAVSRDGLQATSGGFWRAPTTETVWESVLKSPEQVRNCSSCSPFRSKIKTPSRNKHMLLCIYF